MDNEMNTEVTCEKGHRFLAESDMAELQLIPEWLCPECADEWRDRNERTTGERLTPDWNCLYDPRLKHPIQASIPESIPKEAVREWERWTRLIDWSGFPDV